MLKAVVLQDFLSKTKLQTVSDDVILSDNQLKSRKAASRTSQTFISPNVEFFKAIMNMRQ